MVEPMTSEVTAFQEEALEVVSMEVMPFVPMALRTPRVKKSAAKEKQKKQQLVSLSNNPTEV